VGACCYPGGVFGRFGYPHLHTAYLCLPTFLSNLRRVPVKSVRLDPRQKWMPLIICDMAIASGDKVALPAFSPFAAALSGNMRNVVFIKI
jgi:hypothetical protein